MVGGVGGVGVATGGFLDGDEPRQLPVTMFTHDSDPKTGARGGGGTHVPPGARVDGGGVEGGPGPVPGKPISAPTVTPESLTSVVTATHSPLVRDP